MRGIRLCPMRLWGSICAFSSGDAANIPAKLANARRRLRLNRHRFSITPMKSLRKLCCWVGKRTIRPAELSNDDSRHCSRICRFWNTLGAGDLARRRVLDRAAGLHDSVARSASAAGDRRDRRGDLSGHARAAERRRFTTPLAILLALCPAIAGIARNSWTAGGADQYAYVSQADLWLRARPHGSDSPRRDCTLARTR